MPLIIDLELFEDDFDRFLDGKMEGKELMKFGCIVKMIRRCITIPSVHLTMIDNMIDKQMKEEGGDNGR